MGVALRIAVSLTEGGGLDVSPSSQGHEASTLMRGVLQGHLMHYDFYTAGAPLPSLPHPCPPPPSTPYIYLSSPPSGP